MKRSLNLATLAALTITTPAFAHGKSQMWVDTMFNEADTNNNGTISKQEYMTYAEKQFDNMDTKGNGELTKGEIMAYKKNEMKMHHSQHVMNNSSSDATGGTVQDQDRVDTSNDTKSNSRNGSNNGQ